MGRLLESDAPQAVAFRRNIEQLYRQNGVVPLDGMHPVADLMLRVKSLSNSFDPAAREKGIRELAKVLPPQGDTREEMRADAAGLAGLYDLFSDATASDDLAVRLAKGDSEAPAKAVVDANSREGLRNELRGQVEAKLAGTTVKPTVHSSSLRAQLDMNWMEREVKDKYGEKAHITSENMTRLIDVDGEARETANRYIAEDAERRANPSLRDELSTAFDYHSEVDAGNIVNPDADR